MVHLYQELKTSLQVYGLLLLSVATSFCSYAQEENIDEIDSLIDELFFNDQQFLDELLEANLSYNFIHTTISYNSNTYFSGRDSGTNQFHLIPQISYYHSSGFNASVSGIYYQKFTPKWDFTSLSLGYFNTLGKQDNILYNFGYTRFFYSDGYDDFTNSIDVSAGIRTNNRVFGSTLAFSYIFGKDESYQLVFNNYLNLTLDRKSTSALRFKPNLSFIIANQSITFNIPILTPASGFQSQTITQNVFNLLNTQVSFPLSLTKNSWDFELGYQINIPKAFANESTLDTTGFFSISVGYMFDLKND